MTATAKTVHTLRTGDAVTGQYHGQEFTGIITDRRISAEKKMTIFYIDLDAPVEVFGTERESVCLPLSDDDATQRNFSNCRLYL